MTFHHEAKIQLGVSPLKEDKSLSSDIPYEFLRYEHRLEQTQNEIGKNGILKLKLEEDAQIKKTVIRERYSRVPLFSQRALYLEESIPSMAYIYIMTQSGGVLQKDRYVIDISLSNNAYAHITTQGATRIYKMEKGYAMQSIDLNIEEGCYCEYIPDEIIPYSKSRFYQESKLRVHKNATLIYSEIIVPGRVARGELFDFDICYLRTLATNTMNELRFMDTLKLAPKETGFGAIGIMENFTILGSVYILANVDHSKNLKDDINSLVKNMGNIYGGATLLPEKQGVFIRILGNTTENIKEAIYGIANMCRKKILGGTFSKLRKA